MLSGKRSSGRSLQVALGSLGPLHISELDDSLDPPGSVRPGVGASAFVVSVEALFSIFRVADVESAFASFGSEDVDAVLFHDCHLGLLACLHLATRKAG